MLQQDPRSTDGVFQKPEDAPALRDEKCDGKGTCEGAPGTEQPALPPKKKRQSRMQELQEVIKTSTGPCIVLSFRGFDSVPCVF